MLAIMRLDCVSDRSRIRPRIYGSHGHAEVNRVAWPLGASGFVWSRNRKPGVYWFAWLCSARWIC